MLSLALAPGAHAAKPVTVSCGQTITKDTKLANDLTNCPANGLIIGADNITLDLNGHTIDGDGDGFDSCATECDAGVDDSGRYERIKISGGAIREFVSGVDLVGTKGTRVHQLSTTGLAHGAVDISESSDVTVKDVTSVGDGVAVFVSVSRDVRVERVSGIDEEFVGIGLSRSDRVRVAGNRISRSAP